MSNKHPKSYHGFNLCTSSVKIHSTEKAKLSIEQKQKERCKVRLSKILLHTNIYVISKQSRFVVNLIEHLENFHEKGNTKEKK